MRVRDDVLAAPAGVERRRRVAAPAPRAPRRAHESGQIDWSQAAVDSSHVRAKGGASRPARRRSTGPEKAASIT